MIINYRRKDKVIMFFCVLAYLIFMTSLIAFKLFINLGRDLFLNFSETGTLWSLLEYCFCFVFWILLFLVPICIIILVPKSKKMVACATGAKEIKIDTKNKLIIYGENLYLIDDCIRNHISIAIDATFNHVGRATEHFCVWKYGANQKLKFYLNFQIFCYLIMQGVKFTKVDIFGYLTMVIFYFIVCGL